MKWFLFFLCGMLVSCATKPTEIAPTTSVDSAPAQQSLPVNQRVLAAIEKMPRGGGYSLTRNVVENLDKSIGQDFRLKPSLAKPSFCSSATYLVLLETIRKAEADGLVKLSTDARNRFLQVGQDDGVGIWGRWNANGPGTARLFKELKCGTSFTSYDAARAGDFMKMWWTDEIGKYERGHLVVFLGVENVNGVEMVRFWSSNTPRGYGEKTVPKTAVKRVLFSRLDQLQNLNRASCLTHRDSYLANMLRKRYSWWSVKRKCSVRAQP